MLGRMSAGIGLLGQAERTRMTVSRPGSQQKQEAGISLSENFAALLSLELEQRPGTPQDARLTTGANLDLAGEYDKPGVLMHLVLSQPLTSGKLKHDHARRGRGGDDARVVRAVTSQLFIGSHSWSRAQPFRPPRSQSSKARLLPAGNQRQFLPCRPYPHAAPARFGTG